MGLPLQQKMCAKQIEIYDTTLRDGTQAENINFTVEDKFLIAEKLDWLGIHYVEGGWPGSNPRDTEFFKRAPQELKLKKAKLVAFGSTRRAGFSAKNDRVLNALLGANTKTVCIFGKSWDFHVKKVLKVSLKENLELITDSISFLKRNKREVIFDAEHFFDGFKANPKYAFDVLKAAASGGADRLVLCDTNGGTLPHEVAIIIKKVRKIKRPLGIHCHNDTGTAVANSLEAVRAGTTQVQGCMNGLGERCGNANLATVIPNLQLKMNYKCVGSGSLKHLKEVSRFINEMANRSGDRQQPYVGNSAFAHKGGVHVHAVLKNAKTYEHIHPALVGNRQRVLVSDLAGASTVAHKLKEFNINLDSNDSRIRDLLALVKLKESQGYVFEAAEASFEVIIRKVLGQYKPHFRLHDVKVTDVIDEKAIGSEPTSSALIHLAVEGHEEKVTAKGVGPVHAIDQALRKALKRFYPQIAAVRLLDYKVRVLPAGKGTASFVRVLVEFGDGEKKWVTVGVSKNIIHASYQALVDGIDYYLMKEKI